MVNLNEDCEEFAIYLCIIFGAACFFVGFLCCSGTDDGCDDLFVCATTSLFWSSLRSKN